MTVPYTEFRFDTLLTISTGLLLVSYLLGLFLAPVPAAVVSFVLVLAGVIALITYEVRVTAAVIGFTVVGVAGGVIARAVIYSVHFPLKNIINMGVNTRAR